MVGRFSTLLAAFRGWRSWKCAVIIKNNASNVSHFILTWHICLIVLQWVTAPSLYKKCFIHAETSSVSQLCHSLYLYCVQCVTVHSSAHTKTESRFRNPCCLHSADTFAVKSYITCIYLCKINVSKWSHVSNFVVACLHGGFAVSIQIKSVLSVKPKLFSHRQVWNICINLIYRRVKRLWMSQLQKWSDPMHQSWHHKCTGGYGKLKRS